MNEPTQFEGDFQEAVADRALLWLIERDEGFADGRAREFEAWKNEHPRHVQAVHEMEVKFSVLARLPEARSRLAHLVPPARTNAAALLSVSSPARHAFSFWKTAGFAALAAGVVIIVAGGLKFGVGPPDSGRTSLVSDGTNRTVDLRDGSIVHLNAASEVSVHFEDKERRLALVRGEAHFEVAHNPDRPFVVEIENVRVRAVGTAFSVAKGDGSVRIVVTEGKVAVSGPESAAGLPSDERPLEAGQALNVGKGEAVWQAPLEIIDKAAMRDKAMRRRLVEFTLAEAVDRMAKKGGPTITILDSELATRRIGGTFDTLKLEPLLQLLSKQNDIVIERDPGGGATLRLAR
ncbi:MAG: FecR domain-containing protein [Opitutaceae bacterium]|nr:FecR domain-containing protein [Opitutaceae bacterium]